ncbi:hypothetical protein SDRG_16079 [Saprolegnia diclina VS20]|uniref:Uncharacterized protein n=1 Tax=Saprolegnia diclina (strain VS20) TaxID=1156394 RepID=T0PYC6_SAPDV|nr:hypothetical protein SDRG_16079 [Saprolegnia diclina VS20]EQC26060.1 hypothetical protein SDRG_16079 [Saprolegnia diclina VS20]|eukprot:XP_008620497.1 hypothetical protein SDRG_16079 [Saprolegnia diclina VS20]
MAAKCRVLLLSDADKAVRDAKLTRFVRDAHALPVLTFMRWRQGKSPRMVAKGQGQLFEVQKLADDRSLFAPGNLVLQDGRILLVTPMDPRFVLLEAFAQWKRKDQFCTLHDIVEASGVDMRGVDRWQREAISLVCDTSDDEDMVTISVRPNATKILSFLRRKVDRIAAAHKAAAAKPSEQAAFLSDFTLPPSAAPLSNDGTRTNKSSEDDAAVHLQFALLTLSEYVDAFYLHPVIESYGLPLDSWDKEKKADAKPKAAADLIAKYDVRQSAPPSATKRPAPAATAKAAKKKVVNTAGMKSIASFFGAK